MKELLNDVTRDNIEVSKGLVEKEKLRYPK